MRIAPDVIVCLLTTQLSAATTPMDYVLQDWAAAGLHLASAFRVYIGTRLAADAHVVGHLSDRDWMEVQARLKIALAVP